MKQFLLFFSVFLITLQSAYPQEEELKYRRSSIYSILIRHPEKDFGNEIDTVFRSVPVPEKFNDHNLKIRAINAAVTQKNKNEEEQNIIDFSITPFIEKNDIAKRLVSKWFNRKEGKKGDGTFDMNLVIERGLYDADYFAYQLANQSVRGQSLLADAGEDLIGNTFVIFNDIRYFDKEEEAKWATAGITIVGAIVSQFTGGLVSVLVSAGTNVASGITNEIAGFRVSITSYLYQLDWKEESAAIFYKDYYHLKQPFAVSTTRTI